MRDNLVFLFGELPVSNSSKATDPGSLVGVSAWLYSAIVPLTLPDANAIVDVADALLDTDLGNLYAHTIGDPPDEMLTGHDPEITQLGVNLQQQLDAADAAFDQAIDSATPAFIQARYVWSLADEKNAMAIRSNTGVMHSAVDAACANFKAHANHDSKLRYAAWQWTTAQAFTAAELARLTGDATANVDMADAASAMVGAYANYVTSIRVAGAAQQLARSTAWATYWNAVANLIAER